MAVTQPSSTAEVTSENLWDWFRLLLGLATGVLGGQFKARYSRLQSVTAFCLEELSASFSAFHLASAPQLPGRA
jgi:hypothetical protein